VRLRSELAKLYLLQGKSPANFTRSRPQVSRLRFGALCQSRFGVFKCELDAQTASVLRQQMQKSAFCRQISSSPRPNRANIVALRFSALISRREI